MTTESFFVRESVLRDLSRFADPSVLFKGSRVLVTLKHELFDSDGSNYATAEVVFEGKRHFGQRVEFTLPLKAYPAYLKGHPREGDHEFLVGLARFAVEAIRDIDGGAQ